jgi:hypothetical protein
VLGSTGTTSVIISISVSKTTDEDSPECTCMSHQKQRLEGRIGASPGVQETIGVDFFDGNPRVAMDI